MDQGLYILGGIALLVAVLLGYLAYAIAEYRVAVRKARQVAEPHDEPDAEARYLDEDTGDLFSAPREGAAPPRGSEVRGASGPAAGTVTPVATPPAFHIPEVRRTGPVQGIPTHPAPPPPVHAETSTNPASDLQPTFDAPTFDAPPLMPPLSIGQALSSPPPAAARASASPPAVARIPAPASAAARTPEYSLVAPVELHFTEGPGRVGVKPGTRSHAEFQRLAAILLNDLHAARDR